MFDVKRGTVLPPLPARFRLSPEFRLLVASTWVAPAAYAPAQEERIAAAAEDGIDWAAFLSLLDRHRILALHDVLRQVLGSRLPDPVYAQLKSRKADACRQALLQTAELIRLNKAIRDRGIDVLPLKGTMLSLQLYGDPAMRLTNDIDLLVRPEALDAADRLLQAEGYRRRYPDFELTPKRQKWIRQYHHHFVYSREDCSQLIELHWRLYQWRAELVAGLWNCCQPAIWMGTGFLNLDDDALLLYLCDHGATHRWNRIKWLIDITALLAQTRNFSWERIQMLADRFDLSLGLAQAGMLVHQLYGIPLPRPLLRLVANEKRSAPLAAGAVAAMLLTEQEQRALPARLKNAVYRIRIKRKLPGRVSVRSCWLSAEQFKECPLPDRLFWLYYPLGPLLWFHHFYIRKKTPGSQGGTR